MSAYEGSSAQSNVKGDVGTGSKVINIGGNPNSVKTSQGMAIAVVVVVVVIAAAFVLSRRKG